MNADPFVETACPAEVGLVFLVTTVARGTVDAIGD